MNESTRRLLAQTGALHPILCGAMYPCSNPELVAAVSEAGGLGIVQPISLTYVHGHALREGLRYIRRLTSRPIGFNALIEASSRAYLKRMEAWVEVALEEGVRFFISALGNPRALSRRIHAAGGILYHDVTDRRWALKALEGGVDGLICVNDRAGGHAGRESPERMVRELGDLGVPLICAGGVGDALGYAGALAMGYAGVQLGTRFIATEECRVHPSYKEAILRAGERDITLTERLTGVPVSVIRTAQVARVGTRAGPLAQRLLRGRRTKHWVRAWYSLLGLWALRRSSLRATGPLTYLQAGKSVETIHAVEPAGEIVRRFAESVARGEPGAA